MSNRLIDAVLSGRTEFPLGKILIVNRPLHYCPNHSARVELGVKEERAYNGSIVREYSMCSTCGYIHIYHGNGKISRKEDANT